MRMAEHVSRLWVALQCLSRSELLMRMAENLSTGSKWVTLQPECLSRSEQQEWLNMHLGCESLHSPVFEQIRINDMNGWTLHASRMWVALQCLSRSELIRMAEHCIQIVSCSSIWADQNYWSKWLDTSCPDCEFKLLSSAWADQNHWWEWLNMCPGSESPSSVWVYLNLLQEWLLIILYPECNLLSLSDSQCNTAYWLFLRPMLWLSFCMQTLNPMILFHLWQDPIWSRSHLSPFILVCWMPLCLMTFYLSYVWY